MRTSIFPFAFFIKKNILYIYIGISTLCMLLVFLPFVGFYIGFYKRTTSYSFLHVSMLFMTDF